LQRKISDWSARLVSELKFAKCGFFVTLTYEKDPLQLYKGDLQDYFKRLRKAGNVFSYFAIGDYGDTFGRPHYHVIFFARGSFCTDHLTTIWQSGRGVRRRGFVSVSALTRGRISYVVRYGHLAKLDWNKDDGREKPFFLMSKRPALGAEYLTSAMAGWHARGYGNWFYPDGSVKKPLPRYFRDKLFSKAKRERNSLRFEMEYNVRLEAELVRLGKQGTKNPVDIMVEAQHASAEKFLENLRTQKKLKNKLL
jgi:hypothetical protein